MCTVTGGHLLLLQLKVSEHLFFKDLAIHSFLPYHHDLCSQWPVPAYRNAKARLALAEGKGTETKPNHIPSAHLHYVSISSLPS